MKMEDTAKKGIIFSTLLIIWLSLIFHIMSGSLGLTAPVFPRPRPDYELIGMLISGIALAGYSVKTGVDYLRSGN
jgi:hypothetical protein